MTYAQRLFLAKIISTAILVATVIISVLNIVDISSSILPDFMPDRVVELQFSYYNLLILPILLYLLWGGLHGTGRSVRVANMIALAYYVSAFLPFIFLQNYFDVTNAVTNISILGLLVSTLLSIRLKTG